MTKPIGYIEKYDPAKVKIVFSFQGGIGKLIGLLTYRYYQASGRQSLGQFAYQFFELDKSKIQEVTDHFYNMAKLPPPHELLDQIETRPQDFPGWQELGSLRMLRTKIGPVMKLTDGAQQYQPIGDLAWLGQVWKNSQEFYEFVKRPWTELRSYERQVNDEFSGIYENGEAGSYNTIQRPVLIIEYSSLSGGTGSILTPRTVRLRHHICKSRGIYDYEQRINFVLVDTFYRMTPQMLSNAWNTMLKIETDYLTEDKPVLDYGSVQIDQSRPLAVEVNLYGGINDQELELESVEQLADVIMLVDRLKHASGRVSEAFHEQEANYKAFPGNRFGTGNGAIEVKIETEGMEDIGRVMLGQRLVSDHLLRPAAGESQRQAELFVNQAGLAGQQRLFDVDVTGKPIKAVLPSFAGERRQDLPELRSSFDRRFYQAVDQALVAKIEQSYLDFREQLKSTLVEQINAFGLYHAREWLDELKVRYQVEQDRVSKQINRVRKQLESQLQQQSELTMMKVLRPKFSEKFLGRDANDRRQVVQLKQLQANQHLLQLEIEEISLRRKLVDAWLECMNNLDAWLADHLQQVQKTRQAERPVCSVNLFDYLEEGLEEQLIEEQIERHWQAATAGLVFDWGSGLTLYTDGVEPGAEDLKTDAGVEKLLSYARRFLDFSQLRVEDWLKTSGKTEGEWCAVFDKLAAPFITLDKAKHPTVTEIKILGVPGSANSIFSNGKNYGWTVVDNFNPHAIEALIVWKHIDWRKLTVSDLWEQAHRQLNPVEPSVPVEPAQAASDNGKRVESIGEAVAQIGEPGVNEK